MLTVGSSQDQAPASCLLVVIATKLKEPEEGFCEENEVRSEFDKGNICFVKKKRKKRENTWRIQVTSLGHFWSEDFASCIP